MKLASSPGYCLLAEMSFLTHTRCGGPGDPPADSSSRYMSLTNPPTPQSPSETLGLEERTPIVSALVLCYGRLDYLHECLKSVLAQTGLEAEDWEVVLVSDLGEARLILERLTGKSQVKAKFVKSNKRIIGEFLNDGIDACRGELVSLLDDDDLWSPTKLSEVIAAAKSNPRIGLVKDRIHFIDRLGLVSTKLERVYALRVGRQRWTGLIGPLDRALLRVYGSHVFHNESSMSIRRDVIESTSSHLRRITAGLDSFLFFATLRTGYSVCVLPDILTLYRIHPENVSSPVSGQSGLSRLDRMAAYASSVMVSHTVISRMLDEAATPETLKLWGIVHSSLAAITAIAAPDATRKSALDALESLPRRMLVVAPVEVVRITVAAALCLASPTIVHYAYLVEK